MSRMRRKVVGLTLAALTVAAMLGASLGLAFAGTTSLSQGFNLVGGPLQAAVPPAAWVSCLPSNSWSAIYTWDPVHQHWMHFFNTTNGVPAYVNSASAGGITTIPQLAGVALIMNQSVQNAKLADSPGQACTSSG